MKIKYGIAALLSGQLLAFGADLNLLYPLGGEKLPGNGTHVVTWTNSDNLTVAFSLDWYDTNGVPIQSSSLSTAVYAAGTNSFMMYMPSNYPNAFWYKIRLTGDGGIESASDYVFITPPAAFTGSIGDSSTWIPGQSRNVAIAWNGFQSNDICSLILEAPSINREGYGFLMTNFVMGTENGTQTVSLLYPANQTPAYPPAAYALMNGTHSFTVKNQRCGISQTFGSIDILSSGLQMLLLPNDNTNVLRGDKSVCGKVRFDGTLATGDVSISKIRAVFTSYSSNWVALACTLSDSGNSVSSQTLSLNPQTSQQYDTLVEFPVNLTVCQGSIKDLDLTCEVLPLSGLGTFIWNTRNGTTNIVGGVDASYLGGGAVSVSVVSSSGSYMNIGELIYPKFIYSRLQGGVVNYGIICKPQDPYLVLSSSDLVNWNGFYTTNGANGFIELSVPVQMGNHFFRLLETNSPPIAMPIDNLLEDAPVEMQSSRTMSRGIVDRKSIREQIIQSGTFWSLAHPEWPPLPCNAFNLSTIEIDSKVYLQDIGIH